MDSLFAAAAAFMRAAGRHASWLPLASATFALAWRPSPMQPPPERGPRLARVPAALDARSVIAALFDSAQGAGDPVAAHLWLEDPASATLRLVVATGPMAPSSIPVQVGDDPLSRAVTEDTARLAPVVRLRDPSTSTTLWRFALPLSAGGSRGAAAVDFRGASQPDLEPLIEVTAQLRGSLAGALALHVAAGEAATARTLLDAVRELSRRLDPDDVVRATLRRAVQLSHAATASVMLIDPDTGRLRIAAAEGLPAEVVRSATVGEGEGIAGWVLSSGQPLLVEDLPGRPKPGRSHGVRSAVSVPIADQDGILGVLNVGSDAFPARFTSTHMEALEALARQSAVALRNARAVSSARDLYFATLRALALAMETKDPYARGGTARVARVTAALAGRLGLDEDQSQALEVASLLHDMGMGVAGDSLAMSSRPLTTVERGLIKMHPVVAAEILKEVPALSHVAPIVYHHHERYDGNGYVGGVAAEEIPLGARVLAVADSFVAMTSARPYRGAMSVDEALAELEAHAGTQFDPHVVRVFTELVRTEPGLVADRL